MTTDYASSTTTSTTTTTATTTPSTSIAPSTPTTASPSSARRWKNIVIIGASVSGHSLVNALAPTLPPQYRIILIERNEFVQHAPIVVRALVVPGWETKNFTAPIKQETIFPLNSRHRVLCPNRVVKLCRNTVWLEHEFEGADEIEFEKCILATGAQSPLPIRPAPGLGLDDWTSSLRQTQQDIKAATSVLIVGGGSIGIEVAGEIKEQYPNKKVTIVHWDTGLLHPSDSGGNTKHTYVPPRTSAKLGSALERQLIQRGVELVLCDRVDFVAGSKPGQWGGKPGPLGELRSIPLVSGKTVTADYVFNSTGNKPNSFLVGAADPAALTTNGYVSVNGHFRIIASPGSPLASGYYALGDVANAPSWKTGVAATAEGQALAAILEAQIRGGRPKPYSPPFKLRQSTVVLGRSGGAAVLRLPIIGNVLAPDFIVDRKSQDFLTDKNFFSRFQGVVARVPSAGKWQT